MRDEGEEIVTPDMLPLNIRMLPEIGEPLSEVVLNLLTRCHVADDEPAAGQVRPGDLIPNAERVASGHGEEHFLEPKRCRLAARALGDPCQKGNIELRSPDRGEVVFGITIHKIDPDAAMPCSKRADQLRQKPGSEGGKDPDPQLTGFAAADRFDNPASITDLPQRAPGRLEETLASMCQRYALASTMEQ